MLHNMNINLNHEQRINSNIHTNLGMGNGFNQNFAFLIVPPALSNININELEWKNYLFF